MRLVTFAAAFIAGFITLFGCAGPGSGTHVEVQQAAPSVSPVDEHISLARLRNNVELLASDGLEGRGSGEDGNDLAAGYIAGHFAAAGFLPGLPDGTYFQPFEIPAGGEVSGDCFLRFEGIDASAAVNEDFIPFGFSESGRFEGDVVFAGYGITDDERETNDYEGLDVKGKVVLVLRKEPPAWSEGRRATRNAAFATKVARAMEHGAAALLIVNQAPEEGEQDELMRFRAGRSDRGLPVLHVTRDLAGRVLAAGGAGDLSELQATLDSGGFASRALDGVNAVGEVVIERFTKQTRNVVAHLPGTGNHADEHVVIGAHFDHLGSRGGRIFNGADDNASGTAGLIEMAYMFGRMPERERSVVLVAFSGEEIGLLGSRHYVAEPTVPVADMIAMLNMDMIGRADHDDNNHRLAVFGTGTGSTFERIVDDVSASRAVPYIGDPSALGPSDHLCFYEAGVPAMFFFSGLHEDYHGPGDDAEKLNYAGCVDVVRFIGSIAVHLMKEPEPPVYTEVKERADLFRGRDRDRGARRTPSNERRRSRGRG